jgi:hypothetical protein
LEYNKTEGKKRRICYKDVKEVVDATIEVAKKIAGNPEGGVSYDIKIDPETGIHAGAEVVFQFQPKRV